MTSRCPFVRPPFGLRVQLVEHVDPGAAARLGEYRAGPPARVHAHGAVGLGNGLKASSGPRCRASRPSPPGPNQKPGGRERPDDLAVAREPFRAAKWSATTSSRATSTSSTWWSRLTEAWREIVEQRLQTLVKQRQPVFHPRMATPLGDGEIESGPRPPPGPNSSRHPERKRATAPRRAAPRRPGARPAVAFPRAALRLGLEAPDRSLDRVAEQVEPDRFGLARGEDVDDPAPIAYSPGSITVPARA